MTFADDAPVARALDLVHVFHESTAGFGEPMAVAPETVPHPSRDLLDHTSHMTVTMERFHGGPVSLAVIDRKDCPDGRYAREIMLRRPDGRVVQHGIVRIDLERLTPATTAEIRGEAAPLGRILLEAGLLMEVHDVRLLRIVAGPHLASLFGVATGAETFGRVARIDLDGQPAIELLEIAAPPFP